MAAKQRSDSKRKQPSITSWAHQLEASLARLSSEQIIMDAHDDMAEAPDAVVIALRRVVEETRAGVSSGNVEITSAWGWGGLVQSYRLHLLFLIPNLCSTKCSVRKYA